MSHSLKVPEKDSFRKIDPSTRDKFNQLSDEKKDTQQAPTYIVYPFEVKLEQAKTFEEKEAGSLSLIKNHLKEFKKCYVATSYGMDSVVMMHLVIRAAKELGQPIPDMWLNDTLNTFKEEKQYWVDLNKFLGITTQFKLFKPPVDKNGNKYTVWSIAEKVGHLPSFRSMGGRGKAFQKQNPGKKLKHIGSKGKTPECCDILKKKSMKNFLKELPVEDRYDCHFVGTRAEESRMRLMSLLQRCRTYVIRTMFPYEIRAVTPLSYWKGVDIYEYYARYGIPKNPAYKAHALDRMGCASCPAHRYWEIRLAKDPTNEGFGMLKMNLKILQKTEPDRLAESLALLQRYLKKPKSKKELSDASRTRLINLLNEFTHDITMEQFTK